MNMINKEPEREDIEALLPWHAAGTLSRRDADRVEQALAGDRELARRYDLVREELAETIHLNETLGAPSARAMEKLFAAIDAEEARAPAPPALVRSRRPHVGVPVELHAAHAGVVGDRRRGCDRGAGRGDHRRGGQGARYIDRALRLASAASDGSFAVVRFAPQATATEITNFLGAYKATVVEGPLNMGGQLYRIRLSEAKLPQGRGRQDHPSRCRKNRKSSASSP